MENWGLGPKLVGVVGGYVLRAFFRGWLAVKFRGTLGKLFDPKNALYENQLFTGICYVK